MHTGKRTRNIRLKDLKTAYLEQLRERSRARMEEYLQHHTVLESELEECIWEYYRQTAPSLQEFYSRYTPEWEVFYEHEVLPPPDFLIFLKRMETAFRKRYALAELDVSYYIGRLSRLPERSEERAALQELFLDKWHHLLTVKEYDYQYQHLFRLCEGFQILDKSFGLKTEGNLRGSRVKWLLRNHPELYQKVVPYEKAMEQNRQIRELVRCLGKNAGGRKESFDSLSGLRADSLIRHASQSDVEGVTLGDDLNSLLPVEYCYLTDEVLHPFFMQRYVEKRLQQFDSYSHEDTSGSMREGRERLAKSAVLAIARLTEATSRKCYVINFSEDIQTLLIRDLKTDFPMLVDFLQRRFDGGTDVRPAFSEALMMLRTHGWHRSDVVLISDFEMPPPADDLLAEIHRARLRGTSFYALVFGSHPETDYLHECEKYWDMY